MPGRRDGNLRSGDLCEGLGIEALRAFSFVAQIPRTEDVGFDALATLARRAGRQLYPEDSFLVQIKATSVRSIRFENGELDWLRSLQIPLFLLTVDRCASAFDLWSLIRATGHIGFSNQKAVTFYLDEQPFRLRDDEMHASIGPPILRWTLDDAVNTGFHTVAYDVLKAWLTFESVQIAIRRFGVSHGVQWETNAQPVPTGNVSMSHHPRELRGLLEGVCPYIQRLMMIPSEEDASSDGLRYGLLLIADYMRNEGVDPDPMRFLELLTKMKLARGADAQDVIKKQLKVEVRASLSGRATAE